MKNFGILIFLLAAACGCGKTSPIVEPEIRGFIFDYFDSILANFKPVSADVIKAFEDAVKKIPEFTKNGRTALESLGNDTLQIKSLTTMEAIGALKKALDNPKTIGTQIQTALNATPTEGLKSLSSLLLNTQVSLVNTMGIILTVDVSFKQIYERNVTALQQLTKGIVDNCTAAAKEGVSLPTNFFNPKPLIKMIGNPTMISIHVAVIGTAELLNIYVQKFTSTIVQNPWISFLNDAVIAKTQSMLNTALAQLTKLLSGMAYSVIVPTQSMFVNIAVQIHEHLTQIEAQLNSIVDSTIDAINVTISSSSKLSEDALKNILYHLDMMNIMSDLVIVSDIMNGFKGSAKIIIADVVETVKTLKLSAEGFISQIQLVLNITSYKPAKLGPCMIQTIPSIKTIIEEATKGVIQCVAEAQKNFVDIAGEMIASLNESSSEVLVNITACLALESEQEVITCLHVRNIAYTFMKKSPTTHPYCVFVGGSRVGFS